MRLNDHIDLPYTVLTVDEHNHARVIHKVAIAINVQQQLAGAYIPFVNNDNYDSIKKTNRLMLYGPSGCGKSRIILELVRERLDKIRKIVIINPRTAIGIESGRKDILSILNSLGGKDMIIWDNFPDGMVQNDNANIRRSLEIISSKGVNHLLIAVKPWYLERLRNILNGIVADLTLHEIYYNRTTIRKIMNQFSSNLPQFREYENNILDNKVLISEILWKKEPLPITVLDYFKELVNKKKELGEFWTAKETIMVAQKLSSRTDYYDYQFSSIYNTEKRSNEVEFLYVLKLCYELGLSRTKTNVARIQKAIFGSVIPKKRITNLAMWIYYSDSYYSMHDVPRNAIVFDDMIKRKMVLYLIKNLSNILSKDDESSYSLGLFLGKNLKFLPKHRLSWLLKCGIYEIQNKSHFEIGLGHGMGESFGQLSKQIQDEILGKGQNNLWLMRSLGEGLGRNFPKFSSLLRTHILKQANTAPAFSRGLGIGLGNVFILFSTEVQNKIFDDAKDYQQLLEGIGIGIGSIFQYLPNDFQIWFFSLMETDGDFARGLGQGIGHSLDSLSDELKNKSFCVMEDNPEFARGFGMGIGNIVYQFPKELQKEIFLKSEHNILLSGGLGVGLGSSIFFVPQNYQDLIYHKAEDGDDFSLGLGLGMAHNHNYLTNIQKKIFKKLSAVEFFAHGAGRGYGYAWQYLSDVKRDSILKEAEKNAPFARGLGASLGHNLSYLSKSIKDRTLKRVRKIDAFERGFGFGLSRTNHQTNKIKKMVLKIIHKNKLFAMGSGEGFGFSFLYLSDELKKLVFEISENNANFAKGLGEGFGYTFGYCGKNLREEIIQRVRRNENFAEGFGIGIGRGFKYLKTEEKDQLIEFIRQTSFIRLDQKK
ncbi:MAG: hypothetical protein KGH85_05255 [Thaumarchaeota archaeon]|nr:hypothetical protein [Nitrososphaerota archaeon]